MKLFNVILICLFSMLFTGCIGDDNDGCPGSCTLYFDYPDFPDKIDKVNIGIFDSQNMFVTSRELDKRSLSAFQGIRLNLPAGSYVAVCWGNAFENTHIGGFESGKTVDDGRLFHPCTQTSEPIPSKDSLYYSKHDFTVKEIIQVDDTLTFVPAHIRLEVQVKGLTVTNSDNTPFIRVNSLLPMYDFHMQTLGERVSYYPAMNSNLSEKQFHARCNVLRFGNDNPITVDVVENTATNNLLHQVNLSEFMQNNNITITDGQEVTIPILITFSDGNIEVGLIGWEGTPTDPDL